MKKPGQIILFEFPLSDLTQDIKLRPALIIGKIPSHFDDWLVCMISSQLQHYVDGFDEKIQSSDADFNKSGLRTESVIRVGRLAVVDGSIIRGSIGRIDSDRLKRIKSNIIEWLKGNS